VNNVTNSGAADSRRISGSTIVASNSRNTAITKMNKIEITPTSRKLFRPRCALENRQQGHEQQQRHERGRLGNNRIRFARRHCVDAIGPLDNALKNNTVELNDSATAIRNDDCHGISIAGTGTRAARRGPTSSAPLRRSGKLPPSRFKIVERKLDFDAKKRVGTTPTSGKKLFEYWCACIGDPP